MIDARRDEAYVALFNHSKGETLIQDRPQIIHQSFVDELASFNKQVVLCGNAQFKFDVLSNTEFLTKTATIQSSAKGLVVEAHKHYDRKEFAELAYSSPRYLKEFGVKWQIRLDLNIFYY